MKLAYSPASPYVRKVTACAIARGIDAKIERWKVGTTDPALLDFNPLSKVPTLVTDDGAALCLEALGDGILDATHPRRREIALPQDDGRKGYIELQQGKVKRALDALEKDADSLGMLTTIGEITIGCALGYLDFRYANEPWRPGHPELTAWYEKVVNLPPLAETMPVG